MEAVRTATQDDAARLAELADGMVASAATQRGAGDAAAGGWDGPLPAHLARWLPASGRADHRAWVASLEDHVCGFALAHVEAWTDGRRRGVLDACYVEPEARAVGLGGLLVEAAVDWLAEEGCSGVDGTALPGDRHAKNFYEAAGFKARLLTMYRPVGPGTD